MPMMKAQFDVQLNSTSGHCINLEAGVPIWIPPALVAMAITNHVAYAPDAPDPYAETAEPEKVVAPTKTDDNKTSFVVELDQAVTRLIVRNDPTDFKNDGTPKVAKVIAEMDPSFRRVTATEVSEAHARLQENLDLAE